MEKPNSTQLFKDDEDEKRTGVPSDDELRHITGISPTEESAMEQEAAAAVRNDTEEGDSAAASAKELEAGEKTASTAGSTKVDAQAGGLYSGNELTAARAVVIGWRSRKKGILGFVIGLLTLGMFIGFGISSGPAQAIQLSEILQRSFSKNNSDSSTVTNRLFRYARAAKNGDISETRVGILGSKVFGDTIAQLKEIGIDIVRGPTGAPLEVKIDIAKLKTSYPQLDGMSDEEAKSFIADKISGITTEQITGSGGKFSIDQSHFNLRTARLATKSTVGLLDDGKVVNGIKAGIVAKVFNLPSLLHPWDRAVASQENQRLNGTQLKQQQQADEEDAKTKMAEEVGSSADAAVADVEEKSSGIQSGVVKALTFTSGACFARGISGDIIAIDRARVVIPSAVIAMRFISQGQQVKSNQDFTLGQVGAEVRGFTDNSGKTIWQGQALQALAGGRNIRNLADILPDHKQAFLSHNTAASIEKWANDSLGGGTSATLLCSGPGQLIQGVTSIVIAAVGEIGSDGTLTPAIVGAFAAKTSIQFAGTAVFMHFLQQFILNKTTAKALAKTAFSGPEGGNLVAIGSRELGNMMAFISGGVNLGNTTSVFMLGDAQHTFESKSMFAKIFDENDPQSLAGQLAQSMSPNFGQNLSSLFSSFTHLGNILGSAFSSLIPQAAADDGYDWGFGQAGLPPQVLDDPDLQDPYSTGIAKLLDDNCVNSDGSASSSCSYISRAKSCFGGTITHDGGIWDYIPGTPPDPNSNDYINANCNPYGSSKTDDADKNWAKVIMFTASTNDMKGAACHQGDQQSCQDLGAAASDSGTASGANCTSSDASTCSQQLAQQVQDLAKQGKIQLLHGSDADINAAAAGQEITPGPIGGAGATSPCSARTPHILSPELLQVMIGIAQKYSYGIGYIDSNHNCDTGRHPLGMAMDLDTVSGQAINYSGSNAQLDHDFAVYVMQVQKSVEPNGSFVNGQPINMPGQGQKQCQNPSITDSGLLSGFNYFDDSCNHLHVDVGITSSNAQA